MNRRRFLKVASLAGLSALTYATYRFWPDTGILNPCETGLPNELKTHPLMEKVWADIDPNLVWDSHVHIVGTGDSDSGIWFNPNMDSWTHPILKTQKAFYENGACADKTRIDISSIERMLSLTKEMPTGYKSMLFAFDWFHDEQGNPVKEKSIFHIPDSYAHQIASKHSQHFEWVASIHPYRQDAVDALQAAKAKGAKAIKWLPSGMGIDPASSKCDAFYKTAADLGLPIISHTGHEAAVRGGNQNHGNPLRLRRALDHGVTVVMAHCASDGNDEDLDHGSQRVSSIDLFARVMDTPDYQSLAYGEISAITLVNHSWAIKRILESPDWHHRIVNGSDYPLPAIMPLVNTRQLHRMGLLDSKHLPFLQALKQNNALMFDFALKRLMSYQGKQFPAQVFETRRLFEQSI